MLHLLTLAHQSRAVENYDQGARHMQHRSRNRTDVAKRRHRQTDHDEQHAEQEVLVDYRARAAGQFDQERQPAQYPLSTLPNN